MTKYYRRAGTIAYRYIIQAEIEKIELKVPSTGSYPQRISVILKRGDVLRETKNAPLVEGGTAYFDEKLSLPATIYYDTRKKTYLQKEATLAVNVYSKRATKLMGVTKFDLAPFINQNIKEQNIVLKMDKCSDKNAKFFLKISMNQIMELGTSKRSSKHSFKDVMTNSSIRTSFKESQLKNISEIEEHQEKIKEESKIHLEDPKEDEMDDLYSYYTGSNSPTSPAKVKEIEDAMSEIVRSPPKFTENDINPNEPELNEQNFKLDSAHKFYAFDQMESESPQKIETSLLNDEIEEDNVEIIEKKESRMSNSLRKSNQSFHELRNEYDQLRKAYSALEQKYEATVKKEESELQNSNESSLKINLYESRIMELEKKCREAENRNDLLTRKVEELDQINTEYLTQIKGYIEQQNEFTEIQRYDANQFEKTISNLVSRLRQQPYADTKNIESCEVTMKEILQKLVEANNTIMKKEEIYALEKEGAQKQIQALEQNVQRLVKENEQYNQKQKPKTLGASFDNTGLYASFKTREESIIEDNEDTSKFIPNDVADRHQEVSHILDRSGLENSKLAEISALKLEIKELSSKLSSAGNIQNKYEEESQKKALAEQELKSLKKELDKANKGWSYAEEERYELASKLKEYEDGSKMDKKVDMLETELFKLKTRLCEVMNVALEFGRTDMLDRIENIMSTNELSDLRSSIGKQSFWY